LTCVAGGVIKNVPPRRNPAHLSAVFDVLEQIRPKGETQLPAALHELAETARQRALVVILSDFFVEPNELRQAFEHLRFRKHDVAAFHLLDPLELSFEFRRPMRFLDMEGGSPIFAEPNAIAERYQAALRQYLEQMKQIVLESAVDYHRGDISEDYERVLTRFLVERSRKRGRR
ncbi:MAG TPA: DUF58 domain-containing protein, partial [Pirellulales bacterium]|nr:DUF58 domain-containing protein [Pirellulales bacterium]